VGSVHNSRFWIICFYETTDCNSADWIIICQCLLGCAVCSQATRVLSRPPCMSALSTYSSIGAIHAPEYTTEPPAALQRPARPGSTCRVSYCSLSTLPASACPSLHCAATIPLVVIQTFMMSRFPLNTCHFGHERSTPTDLCWTKLTAKPSAPIICTVSPVRFP
jgi:hypothetical protein